MDIEDILLEVARPELYTHNIFRVTELPVDAEARDLSRRQATIKQALDIGVPIPPGYGRMLPLGSAPNTSQFSAITQLFEDPVRRLIDEIFWFWPQPAMDGRSDAVLQQLSRGELESVSQFWQRERDLPANEGTALHNLAVFSHVMALDWEQVALNRGLTAQEQQQQFIFWQEAFACWRDLLECEAFWSRVAARIRALDDPRLTTGMVSRLRAQLPATLLFINARLAIAAAERGNMDGCNLQLDLIFHAGFDRQIADDVLHRVIEPLHERIKMLCKTTYEKVLAEPSHGHILASGLLDQTASMLTTLDLLLPAGDITREGIHDEVAERSLMVETYYGNTTDDWQTYLPMTERIEPLVASQLLRSRLKSEREKVQKMLESRLCWYCHTGYAEEKSVHGVKMYGNVRRYSVGYRRTRVEWQRMTVFVARCPECSRLHEMVQHWKTIGARLGVILGIVLGAILLFQFIQGAPPSRNFDYATYQYVNGPPDLSGPIIGGVVLGIVFIVIFLFIGGAIGNAIGAAKYLKPVNVRGRDNVRAHPTVKEWRSRGWHIGDKPST